MVGAQWLLLDEPRGSLLVALVQVGATLPIMLLALPSGVVADAFDRRLLLITIQSYFMTVGLVLTALSIFGTLPPVVLLTLVLLIGTGTAALIPTWGASIPDLVPRKHLRAAARLDLLGVNVAKAAGPALAGLVIAHFGGVQTAFALSAACNLIFIGILCAWRKRPAAPTVRDRFFPALRTGGRYMMNEPVMRRLLLRSTLFVSPGVALWALLPVVARRELDVGAAGFGWLFGALGLGAVLGATVVGRIAHRFGTNFLLTTGAASYAGAMVLLVLIHDFGSAVIVLVLAGTAWMIITSTLQAELQMALPGWVRARGVALYIVVYMGSQTIGSFAAGVLAETIGVSSTLMACAGLVGAGALVGLVVRVPDTDSVEAESVVFWDDADLALEPDRDVGPVLVTLHFTIPSESQDEFLLLMQEVKRSRLRTGATEWSLYRDGSRPDSFVELFTVATWGEHLQQHEGRLTAQDEALETAARSLSVNPVAVGHLLPP